MIENLPQQKLENREFITAYSGLNRYTHKNPTNNDEIKKSDVATVPTTLENR